MTLYSNVKAVRRVITPVMLREMMPRCPKPVIWAREINLALDYCKADPALFIAHIAHESSDLTQLVESLNYSERSLLKTFRRHRITREQAAKYGRNNQHPADQQTLANILYGGKWGAENLGNTEPGDGWLFRGQGPKQITGRYNYTKCAEATGFPLVEQPGLLATDPHIGMMAAAWFWAENVHGDTVDVTTREINGGTNGLQDRRERYQLAKKVLARHSRR